MKLIPHLPTNIIPHTTFTATTWSALLHAPSNSDARFFYSISNVSGTSPSLSIIIDYINLSGTPIFVASSNSKTTDTSGSFVVQNTPINYKVLLNITGTNPSFTVELDVQYQEL